MYLPPTTGIRHQANTHPSVPDLPLHGTEPPVPWVLWCPPCQPATLPLCWTACRARVPDCLSAELPSCLGVMRSRECGPTQRPHAGSGFGDGPALAL
jgi:hypothetical protein